MGEPFCLDGALDEQMSHGQLCSIWNEKQPDNEMGVEHKLAKIKPTKIDKHMCVTWKFFKSVTTWLNQYSPWN